MANDIERLLTERALARASGVTREKLACARRLHLIRPHFTLPNGDPLYRTVQVQAARQLIGRPQ